MAELRLQLAALCLADKYDKESDVDHIQVADREVRTGEPAAEKRSTRTRPYLSSCGIYLNRKGSRAMPICTFQI
jgi:hypothetical protein